MIIVIKNTLTNELRVHEIEPTDDLDLEDHEEIVTQKTQATDYYASDDSYGSRPGEYDHRYELYLSECDSYNEKYENFRNQY